MDVYEKDWTTCPLCNEKGVQLDKGFVERGSRCFFCGALYFPGNNRPTFCAEYSSEEKE